MASVLVPEVPMSIPRKTPIETRLRGKDKRSAVPAEAPSYPSFSVECKSACILVSGGQTRYFRRFAPPSRSHPSAIDSGPMISPATDNQRIVITGIGLTAPNGNTLAEYRDALLDGRSGVQPIRDPLLRQDAGRRLRLRRAQVPEAQGRPPRHPGRQHRHLLRQRGDRRLGPRLGERRPRRGSASTSASPSTATSRPRTRSTRSRATTTTRSVWSHHHNPRTVANNPAGEITLNLGITGPHYTLGAACAAGNAGLIQGAQMLRLGECDVATRRRRLGEHPHLRHLRQLPQPGRPGHARRSRPRPRGRSTATATASSWPRGLPVRARTACRRQAARREDLRRDSSATP